MGAEVDGEPKPVTGLGKTRNETHRRTYPGGAVRCWAESAAASLVDVLLAEGLAVTSGYFPGVEHPPQRGSRTTPRSQSEHASPEYLGCLGPSFTAQSRRLT